MASPPLMEVISVADHDYVKITRRPDGFLDFQVCVKGKYLYSGGTLEEIQHIAEIVKKEIDEEVRKWTE
jgi:hypothetical protein